MWYVIQVETGREEQIMEEARGYQVQEYFDEIFAPHSERKKKYLGKWHLDGAKESEERAGTHYIPRERRGGFDSWLGYENNNAQYDCYLHGHRGDREVEMFRLPTYETDAMTDLMINI